MPDETTVEREEVRGDEDNQVDVVRMIVFEDVLAAQDSDQIIVSTNKDLPISVKRVTAETGARQWGGQWSDASLQQLSQDRRTRRSAHLDIDDPTGAEAVARFNDVYGTGKKLPQKYAST
jgi:hypothetical protein